MLASKVVVAGAFVDRFVEQGNCATLALDSYWGVLVQQSVTLTINGKNVDLVADPDMPLLWAIRDLVGLTGTKFGCGAGLCGACTVYFDGEPVRSCQILVGSVDGAAITTIEGLDGPLAEAVRAAWLEHDVVQCGYCQSGQILTATSLLSDNPSPTREDIDDAMSGNVCRCGSYQRMREAIMNVSGQLKDKS